MKDSFKLRQSLNANEGTFKMGSGVLAPSWDGSISFSTWISGTL